MWTFSVQFFQNLICLSVWTSYSYNGLTNSVFGIGLEGSFLGNLFENSCYFCSFSRGTAFTHVTIKWSIYCFALQDRQAVWATFAPAECGDDSHHVGYATFVLFHPEQLTVSVLNSTTSQVITLNSQCPAVVWNDLLKNCAFSTCKYYLG